MSKRVRYPRGDKFPNEGFVQRAIEVYFTNLGFELERSGYSDLVCKREDTGECWLVEAKGLTTEVGLDFRTGLGQLIQRMTDDHCNYGLAVPQIDEFIRQCQSVSQWVRTRLRLNWLIVGVNGSTNRVLPGESPPNIF